MSGEWREKKNWPRRHGGHRERKCKSLRVQEYEEEEAGREIGMLGKTKKKHRSEDRPLQESKTKKAKVGYRRGVLGKRDPSLRGLRSG